MLAILRNGVNVYAIECFVALSINVLVQITLCHNTSERLWMFGVCKAMVSIDGLQTWCSMRKS